MIKEYVHEDIGCEVNAISGHYSFNKEVKIAFENGEIFYLVGSAVVDSSCCGVGGCGFALVAGYVISWKTRVNKRGKVISQIEPISDRSIQKTIVKLIEESEIVNQVQFW